MINQINLKYMHKIHFGNSLIEWNGDEGAKEMLLVDDVDNKGFLIGLFNSMYDELPAPNPKK